MLSGFLVPVIYTVTVFKPARHIFYLYIYRCSAVVMTMGYMYAYFIVALAITQVYVNITDDITSGENMTSPAQQHVDTGRQCQVS